MEQVFDFEVLLNGILHNNKNTCQTVKYSSNTQVSQSQKDVMKLNSYPCINNHSIHGILLSISNLKDYVF